MYNHDFKWQELFILRKHLGSSPVFDVVCIVHLFSFLCGGFALFILSCVPCVVFGLFVFVLCLVYPVWFLLCLSLSCVSCTLCCFWFVCLCPVSRVPCVVFGLFIFVLCLVYPVWFWFVYLCPVSCVPCVVFGLFVFVLCLVYPVWCLLCLALSCVLCTLCGFWFVYLCPVSCVPCVVFGLFVFVLCLVYPVWFLLCLALSCVLCTLCGFWFV